MGLRIHLSQIGWFLLLLKGLGRYWLISVAFRCFSWVVHVKFSVPKSLSFSWVVIAECLCKTNMSLWLHYTNRLCKILNNSSLWPLPLCYDCHIIYTLKSPKTPSSRLLQLWQPLLLFIFVLLIREIFWYLVMLSILLDFMHMNRVLGLWRLKRDSVLVWHFSVLAWSVRGGPWALAATGARAQKQHPRNLDNGIMIIAYVNPRIQVHLVHVANAIYIVSSFFIGYIVNWYEVWIYQCSKSRKVLVWRKRGT